MRSDTSLQSVDCALGSFAQECLEGVEDQLYRVKVRRILRQVAEICASSADRLPYTSDLVEGHVIDHHEVPTLECKRRSNNPSVKRPDCPVWPE